MSDRPERPKRENVIPLDQIEDLAVRVLGAALPDRLVTWIAVSKRNAERWLSGESTWPPGLVSDMQKLAPLCDQLIDDLDSLVHHYKREGVPENLIKLRIREFSKELSDAPPPKPPAPNRY